VDQVVVAHGRVNAERGTEAGDARHQERLPQAPRDGRHGQHADEGNPGRDERTAEAGPIVRDQRHEARADLVQRVRLEPDERDVLRHEHDACADGEHGDAAHQDADGRGEQEERPEAAAGPVPPLRTSRATALSAIAKPHECGHEDRHERRGGHGVPGVEVAVAEEGEEAEEPRRAARRKRPQRPALAGGERKDREPGVERADRDQGAAEGDPIVEHERHDAATGDCAQLGRGLAEEQLVVGQEQSRERLEDREAACQRQAQPEQRSQRPAIPKDGCYEAPVGVGNGDSVGSPPAGMKRATHE
jgi:hypothetical protein